MKLNPTVQLAILALAYTAQEITLNPEQENKMKELHGRLIKSVYYEKYETIEAEIESIGQMFDFAVALIDQALKEEGL